MEQQTATPAHGYQEYFGPAIFEPLTSLLLGHAQPRPGDRVLDVACGTGIVTRRIPPMVGANGRVVGVDINPGMIAVAQTIPAPDRPPIEWRQGDALALDLPDGAFDLVICQQGLQFFPDRAAGLREMRRVLADGGRVLLAVWRGVDHHPLYEGLADAEAPYLGELGVPVTRDDLTAPFSLGDRAELVDLLAGAGFHDIDVVERSIEARFATPERFVERLEFAYAAVVPQFAEDPATFDAYLANINEATEALVDRHRDGDHVVVPMHAHIVVAHV